MDLDGVGGGGGSGGNGGGRASHLAASQFRVIKFGVVPVLRRAAVYQQPRVPEPRARICTLQSVPESAALISVVNKADSNDRGSESG